MILVVTDTNVFIDLMSVDALEAFFALGLEVHTTGFVTNELNKEQSALLLPHIGGRRLLMDRFTDDSLTELIESRVGEDLNWIRLNGTFVGGLIGVVLYLLFALSKV